MTYSASFERSTTLQFSIDYGPKWLTSEHRLEFDLRVLCFSSTMSFVQVYTTIIYCMRLHIKMYSNNQMPTFSVNVSLSHTLFPLLLLYRSTGNPLGIPAFSGSRSHRTNQMGALTSAVAKMAQVMTPPSHSHFTIELSGNTSTIASISPAKLANLRSNHLQQIPVCV